MWMMMGEMKRKNDAGSIFFFLLSFRIFFFFWFYDFDFSIILVIARSVHTHVIICIHVFHPEGWVDPYARDINVQCSWIYVAKKKTNYD